MTLMLPERGMADAYLRRPRATRAVVETIQGGQKCPASGGSVPERLFQKNTNSRRDFRAKLASSQPWKTRNGQGTHRAPWSVATQIERVGVGTPQLRTKKADCESTRQSSAIA